MNLAELEFFERDGLLVAVVRGELDRSNTFSIQDAVTGAVANTSLGLVLDLSGATYMDSSGIRMIYQLRERLDARGQTLALVLPADAPATHALRLAGVSGHIPAYARVEDVWAAVRSRQQSEPERGQQESEPQT